MARNPGRVVGLWYLSLLLFGPLTLIYIPDKLYVHNDAAATAANIAAHQTLFKIGMLSGLFGSMMLIFLVFAFYRLFKDVDRELSWWLVFTGGVMPAVLGLAGFAWDAGALTVAQGQEQHRADPAPHAQPSRRRNEGGTACGRGIHGWSDCSRRA